MNVVIATYGPPMLLERTLESLLQVRRPPRLQRIIVVENGSDAGAAATCAAFAGRLPMDYYRRKQAGKSRALQWAIDALALDGPVVFFDDDIRLAAGVLEAYAAAAERHGPRCFFGGPLEVDYEETPPPWLMEFLPPSAKGWHGVETGAPFEPFLGANYAVFAEAVREVGGFNADLGPGARRAGTEGNPTGQERELQMRLWGQGYSPVFVPDAVVWHHVPRHRCSPQWALHRAYRNAMSQMLSELRPSDPAHQGPRMFGVPRWILREYLQAWLAARAATVWPGDPVWRYRLRWREASRRGELVGLRQGLARHDKA